MTRPGRTPERKNPVTGDGLPLGDDELAYLAGLVAADIRKKGKSVDGFEVRPGQDPADAAAVLTGFERNIAWRREVLGKLADATGTPGRWRASAAAELDLGPDEQEEQRDDS
jgi:hypothetical protein